MGRKRTVKQLRKLFEEARQLERQGAKLPCDTCAFKDPEAWVSDQAMAAKILKCLKARDEFFCHAGMPLGGDEQREYQPPRHPDGTVDRSRMEPCGGFIRWAAERYGLSETRRIQEVAQLQRHMMERFLASDREFAQECRANGYDADMLALGVNTMAELMDEPPE